jgi:hypothetical protein
MAAGEAAGGKAVDRPSLDRDKLRIVFYSPIELISARSNRAHCEEQGTIYEQGLDQHLTPDQSTLAGE